MASASYLRKKREKTSERNRLRAYRSNEVQREKRVADAVKLHVVGGFHTYGSMGYHHIEILDCGEESHFWLSVDGDLRRPRTEQGFRRVLADWALRRKVKSNAWYYTI